MYTRNQYTQSHKHRFSDLVSNFRIIYKIYYNLFFFLLQVSDEGIFGSWFKVHPNGSVFVSQKLDRGKAAVLTLPVIVIDSSAPSLQQSDGKSLMLKSPLIIHDSNISSSHILSFLESYLSNIKCFILKFQVN